MEITAYTINAFAKTESGGNPAGVVPDANGLTEEQMKRIAKRMALSETAFVMRSDTADFRVCFFTPTDEVDLCGHATIGTFSLMLKKGLITPGTYSQETKAGVLGISADANGIIMMEQTNPLFFETADAGLIADSLNISADALDETLPPRIVSTGLRDIMISVRSRSTLDAIKPDFEKVTAVSEKYGVVGYHMFTLDTLSSAAAYCRNLAPLYGIPEEAATGTSNGALACFLWKNRRLKDADAKRLCFEQGYSMGRPSEILVRLETQGKEIQRVLVGGRALGGKEVLLDI